MGNNNLAARADGQTVQAADVNQFRTALSQDLLPRDGSGNVAHIAGNLGSSSVGWNNLYINGQLIQNNVVIDLSQLSSESHQIISGREKTSGFPDYLSFVASTTTGRILATTTPLSLLINASSLTLNSNVDITGLATAPATNNTCLVNDTSLKATPDTRYLGEDDRSLTIDTIGTNITALNGTIQAFRKGSEYFLALVDTTNNRLFPFKRGIALTDRETLSDNDTITLMRANYIFINKDGITTYQTSVWPEFQDVDPSGVSGQFYFNTGSKRWRRFTSSWDNIDAIWLGIVICDNSQAVAADPLDFTKKWKDDLEGTLFRVDGDTVRIIVRKASIAGRDFENIDYFVDIKLSTTGDREAGISEAANTIFYIYVDRNLKYRFSTIAPRQSDYKLGLYHPKEYWRCIGFAYNDASSNIVDVSFFPKTTRSARYTASKPLLTPYTMGCTKWDSANTFTVPWFSTGDKTRQVIIEKDISTQLNIDNAGLNGIAQSANLAGTASCSGVTVTGSGTSFQNDFIIGDVIWFTGGAARRITAIASQTSMTVESSLTQSAVAYRRGGKAPNTVYSLYAISGEAGEQPGLILSTRSDKHSEALLDMPTGYQFFGQLPHYIVTDSSSNQRPYTVVGGPWNFLVLPDENLGNSITAGANAILNNGSATTFTALSLSGWVPKICPAVIFKADSLYTSGQAEFRVRKGGSSHEGYSMGVTSSAARAFGNPVIALNASREVEYRLSLAGGGGWLWLMGVYLEV